VKIKKAESIGLACQIAFEYEKWGWEHISDMLATYEYPEKPPCDGDTLLYLCNTAAKHKKDGLDFKATEKEMMKMKRIAA